MYQVAKQLGNSVLAPFGYAGTIQFIQEAIRETADFETEMLALSLKLDLPVGVTTDRFSEYCKSTPFDWRVCLICVYTELSEAIKAMTEYDE